MSTTSHAGRFIWRELMSTDTAAARTFYSKLFDWSVKEVDMGMEQPYILLHNDDIDEDTAGVMAPPMEGVPSNWMNYISVDDVDAAAALVEKHGGKILAPPFSVPGVGRMAPAMDPQGASFSLFKGEEPGASDTERTPPERTFCWSQLMTKNVDAAVPFYSAIFGWTAAPMGPGTVVFSTGEQMRASAMQFPDDAGDDMHPHWLAYVAVEDCDASFAKAKALGATVYKEPTTMPDMGRFAVLADPTGAVFALWKDLSPNR